ncbi:MAG: ankyrin repeat domain-containing protein [Sedimentisphaerales bacterium]
MLGKGIEVNTRDRRGETALTMAVQNGNIEIVRLLLEKGADANVKNTDGITALIIAAGEGHTEIVKLLLKKRR